MNVFVTGAAGFIGGSIATGLVAAGHRVSGLVRHAGQAEELHALGITPVLGTLDDSRLLAEQARQADAVINAASSDHRGAVEALLDALRGSDKVFLHTSGSSIVGDAAGGKASDIVYDENNLPQPTVDKAARVAIDNLVLAAAKSGVRSAVLCNTLIYGHSLGVSRDSVQLPRLLAQARKSGVVRHVGSGASIWSNVHIEDVVALYLLALQKSPAGTFYFVESGEAAFIDMTTAMAKALNLGEPQDWPLADAEAEWGYEMANYALGSNSRVRGTNAREWLGWAPKRTSVTEWILNEMI
ncbi:epimerase [Pseudomonas agarici]|uniref:Epimerase n=1 Tax=Pseudomonas agarici TaxID=46677 RepID=A0A0X1T536_PSEAA|nr:NAD-dependent epimerase/dehydratase family protein [Pseudomonas agarici]AMB87234.1 epimerase [Pseudomonas agarici]NWB92677.1 NAD-dependent epimerase/dehydratase family protein [Pseudomonas agarici]NWC10637.1 NAD-dependent epimerase/dehydratase family protein [Pseudomonas agarici]SEL11784.1 Nucleoside-diphosphate-sugar epimerase [Pseudomonas agarici]